MRSGKNERLVRVTKLATKLHAGSPDFKPLRANLRVGGCHGTLTVVKGSGPPGRIRCVRTYTVRVGYQVPRVLEGSGQNCAKTGSGGDARNNMLPRCLVDPPEHERHDERVSLSVQGRHETRTWFTSEGCVRQRTANSGGEVMYYPGRPVISSSLRSEPAQGAYGATLGA